MLTRFDLEKPFNPDPKLAAEIDLPGKYPPVVRVAAFTQLFRLRAMMQCLVAILMPIQLLLFRAEEHPALPRSSQHHQ